MNVFKRRRMFCQHGCTYVGWDVRSLQWHKATECELVKKSGTFIFRGMNQHMTQILCRNKKTVSKTCPELPWNHHGEKELILASLAVMNYCLCADLLCHLRSTYTVKCWIHYPLADPLCFPACPPVQRQFFRSVSSQVMLRPTQLQPD